MEIEVDYYTDFNDEKDIEEYNKLIRKYKNKIENILKLALEKQGIYSGKFYIGVGIVSESNIKDINKKCRNIDKVTDVLSFPMYERQELEKLSNGEGNNEQITLGDIVICLDKVKNQSVEYGTGFEREILYMIAHGVCHLIGYDHEIEQEKVSMRKLEEEILKEIEGEK